MNKHYYVYIVASKCKGTLYIGVTSNLIKRIWQHKTHALPGFTDKYNVGQLVYYEIFDNPDAAIRREKRLKHWNRQWKIELIERANPQWKDLYDDIADDKDGSSGQAGG